MRASKRSRRPHARGQRLTIQGNDVATREVPQHRYCDDHLSCENDSVNGRILVDRFGHQHRPAILKLWPEAVKRAMGLKFVDPEREARHGG
jgi:hypothetical protein